MVALFAPIPAMTVLEVFEDDPPEFASGRRDKHTGDYLEEDKQILLLNPIPEEEQIRLMKRGSRRNRRLVGNRPEFSAVVFDFMTGEVETVYVSATLELEIRP